MWAGAWETSVDRPRDGTTLQLIERLAAALAESKVRYCHWKSNESIGRSLQGLNDLDLLVHREDVASFFSVTTGLGFRPAVPAPRKQIPGIVDLYGLDAASGRLVQVQAHFRLVLGDDMTKNVVLPIESDYLTQLDESGVLPLPRPEYEYLVFVVRMVLKHCPWDAQVSYKGRLTPSERRELVFLEDRVEPDEVDRLRMRHLPTVSDELFARCRRALEPKAGPLIRARAGWLLARALEGYAKRSASHDTATKLARRLTGFLIGRIRPSTGGKQLVEGGAVIAVVGGDGSGKTSSVDDLSAFLGRHLVTRRLHLGKPRPSLTTALVRRVARRLAPDSVSTTGVPTWVVEAGDRFPGYVYALWHLMIARDRHRTHLEARRVAGRGSVVVCDRYPLPGLTTMDCARLDRMPRMGGRPLAALLARLERSYYEKITPPDAAIVLRVRPSVAAARRPEQDVDFVRRRAAEIYEREWVEPYVFVVDGERELERVARDVRVAAWSVL